MPGVYGPSLRCFCWYQGKNSSIFGLIFLPVVAIYLTWKRIKIAAREAHTSRDNLRAARDALQHSERTLSYTVHKDEVDQLHGRYADASGRLSSDNDPCGARLRADVQADLSGSELQGAKFSSPWVVRGQPRPDVRRIQGGLVEVGRVHADSYTRLAGANFSGSRMLLAELSGTDLQGAVMSDTHLTLVKLTGASLHRTKLSGTDLSGFHGEGSTTTHPPTGLTQTQLDQACADPDNPPKLDEDSGLVWNPQPCPARAFRRIVGVARHCVDRSAWWD